MPRKNMSPPAPLSTILQTYRQYPPEAVRQLEQDHLGQLQYMASRLHSILTALADRMDYQHEWWIENIEYEMVFYFILFYFILF